ncbi:hypothetical protein CPC08DRAFT_456955 [Agrocybe pediades]|nr:hypothetical protein CPC08DRAFT_456955 [Agrocybe pediades]
MNLWMGAQPGLVPQSLRDTCKDVFWSKTRSQDVSGCRQRCCRYTDSWGACAYYSLTALYSEKEGGKDLGGCANKPFFMPFYSASFAFDFPPSLFPLFLFLVSASYCRSF